MQELHTKTGTFSKGWLVVAKITENTRKWKICWTNCHLYNYCSNNPVRYIDLDGKYAGLVLDRADANGMGHIGLFVQTGKDSWSYFEVYPFDKNEAQAYHHVKGDDSNATITTLSKNKMSFPCGKWQNCWLEVKRQVLSNGISLQKII